MKTVQSLFRCVQRVRVQVLTAVFIRIQAYQDTTLQNLVQLPTFRSRVHLSPSKWPLLDLNLKYGHYAPPKIWELLNQPTRRNVPQDLNLRGWFPRYEKEHTANHKSKSLLKFRQQRLSNSPANFISWVLRVFPDSSHHTKENEQSVKKWLRRLH